jgi:hypothetical protein
MAGPELPEYPGEVIDPGSDDQEGLRRLISIRETQLSESIASGDELKQRYEVEVTELRASQTQLQSELAQVRAEYDDRLESAVEQALEAQGAEHKQALDALREERDGLLRTVADLQEAVGAAGEERTVEPASLVDKFASVLEQMAEREPTEGRPYAVNLASLQVEARGVLRAPAEAEAPPEFVTVAPGTVDPGQLSTMRMEFRVTPRSPGEARPEA